MIAMVRTATKHDGMSIIILIDIVSFTEAATSY